MRIGIFGCTADPFTIAHREIVNEVLKQDLVDDLIILPTIVSYHRPGKTRWLTDDERVRCIGEMTNDLSYRYMVDMPNGYSYSRIHVSRFEIDMKKKLASNELESRRSFHMIPDLMCEYGNEHEYYYIIGSDSLENFKTWYRWEDVLKMTKLIVVTGRNGGTVDTDIPYIPVTIDNTFSDVSASNIRGKYSSLEEYLKDVKKSFKLKS